MTQSVRASSATIVITTKNRRDDLRLAVRSALEQTVRPEVLVIDDGSTDGTSEMIRDDFPEAKLVRSDQSLGLIVQRNRAASIATGDVIFSIDDDALFSTPRVVEQTLAEFDHPRIGAVAIPFINVKKENIIMQRAPGESGIYCAAWYIGTAHAVRRDVFLNLNGYREYLFHQGEEPDFCIRMLDAGFVIRSGRSDPIHHFESPRRDFHRMDIYGRRNDVLYAWYNAPWPILPMQLAGTTVRGLMFGLRVGRPWTMLVGLAKGYRAIAHERRARQPVSTATFRLSRRLKKAPLPLMEIEESLGPVVQLAGGLT